MKYQIVDNYGVVWKKGLTKKEAEEVIKYEEFNSKTKKVIKGMV